MSTPMEDRRSRTREVLDELVEERQQVLVALEKLAGLAPFQPDHPLEELLPEFLEVLVDYVALWHFEVYQRIEEGQERRARVKELAEEVYPGILASTQVAVHFNDFYEELPIEQARESLHEDLSKLGEALAGRIELEDRFIDGLLAAEGGGAASRAGT